MILGALATYTRKNVEIDVRILSADGNGSVEAERAGFKTLIAWPTKRSDLAHCMKVMTDFDPDAVLVLGADVMDGYYNPATALRLLAIADLHARRGAQSTILGFSFNKHPAPEVVRAFRMASPALRINVRDPVSLARFGAAVGDRARLVADMAFQMPPDTNSHRLAPMRLWLAEQRAAGRTVLGVNAHPMLFLGQAETKVHALVASLVHAMGALLDTRDVALVFLSHDDRAEHGDDVCLRPLHIALESKHGPKLFYPADQLSAPELKAAASMMDGVVTGRMHLSIAALGSGVAVAGLTYQDKFEGLFEHFGLSREWLLSGESALDESRLTRWVQAFVDQIPDLRNQVASRLPDVMALSYDNVSP